MLFERVAVVGVGLIGGSLALAARQAAIFGEVTGVGRTQSNLDVARERGIIERSATDVSDIGPVDLVVLAVPVRSTGAVAQSLVPYLRPGTVLTDVGSVKGSVITEVESVLPRECPFVGAHPIAGSEQTGAAAARVDLFRDALCVVTPGASATAASAAREAVIEMWRAVGARVRVMSGIEHDRALAWTSHLGHAMSYALARAIGESREDLLPFAGPSLRDWTRLAGGSSAMWRDIFFANRDAVVSAVDEYTALLSDLRRVIVSDDEAALDAWLERGRATRRAIEDDS